MKLLQVLTCAVILYSGVTRAADPQPLVSILDLPRESWWGGPSYYAQFPKAAASGWTNASFFPLAVFLGKPQHAAALKAAGINTYMGAEHDGWSMSSMTGIGMYVLPGEEWTVAEVGDDPRAVGWHVSDEAEMSGSPTGEEYGGLARQAALVEARRSLNDGRFIQANFGNGVLRTFWSPNTFDDHIGLMDVTSVDKYAYTSPHVQWLFENQTTGWPAGKNPSSSGAYGWQQDVMEEVGSKLNGVPVEQKPNWIFVETAMPYLSEAGARTIGLEEFEGAVWNAIIHGAAGIAYFQHNNNGLPGYGTYSIIECPAERTAKITAVNAQVTRLAPVLNTQPYQWSFGTGLDTSFRVHDGYAYIFAMTTGGTGTRTFTFPVGVSGTQVEVVDEGRTLTVTSGTFTDSFAAEYEHHIYRVIIPLTAPAIATQPADRTVSVGQTATFSVTATGAAPIYYQWQTNSVNLAGATNASYTTPATILADSGKAFRVIITNSLGSVTSSVATLTVLPPDNTPPAVSLTAPGNGATVSNTVTVSATATDNVAVAGVQFKLDGANLGAEDTSNPYSISWDTWTAANGSHTLTAVARDAAGNATTSTAVNVTVNNVGGLPSPWITADIGSVSLAGIANYSNGNWTVVGSGADIWNAADAFRYVYQSISGDCSLVARVASIQNTDPWAKAGVMIRETTAAGAIYAGVFVTPGNGITFHLRTSTGGLTTAFTYAGLNAPYWVRLTRTGNSFAAYYSPDGTSWTPLGTAQTITMATSATIGLAVTAHNAGARCTSTISNVTVGGGVADPDTDGDGLLDSVDPDDDNDGMSDVDEAVAGTVPTNRLSVLRIVDSEFRIPSSEFVIRWQSASNRQYTVQAATNLLTGFTLNLRTNIVATYPINVYTQNVSGAVCRFYRVTASTAGNNWPPLWNAVPPTGVSPAPSGPVAGVPGQFDTAILATNEVWDNFDGAAGSNPDGRLWLEDTINQGGTQVYDPAQSFLDGNGNAVLEAIQNGSTILSGRFTSRTKYNMQYGWCAARIKFPKAGRAWFPAFWLLFVGYNTGNPYGEIDMMEFFGNTKEYSTHVHFGADPSLSSYKDVPDSHSGGDAGDGFHTYWMQWEPDRILIGVDDLVMGDWGPTSVPAGYWDHMRQPFYFIANFAAAPSWLPAPLPSDFPARMQIDWIWYKPLPAPAQGN